MNTNIDMDPLVWNSREISTIENIGFKKKTDLYLNFKKIETTNQSAK